MNKYIPAMAVMLAALLWSLDGYIRQELYILPAMLIVAVEHSLGAVIFLPALFRGRDSIKQLTQRGWISILWISLGGGLLGTFCYTKALSYVQYIDLSVVVMLQKLQPVFAISLAAIILRETITKRFLILAGFAIFGGYLTTFGFIPISDSSDKTIIAALLALMAALFWGSSTVLGKYALLRLPLTVVTALRLIITAIISIFLLFMVESHTGFSELKAPQWIRLFMIVFSSGSVALVIYYYGLKYLSASHTTLYELFWPLSALGFDYFFRGRVLSGPQLLGAMILLTSIIFLTRTEKRIDDKPNQI